MTTVAQISLRNGVKMPQEGLGVFQINDPKLCEETVLHALHNGYRLFDTASSYQNEQTVGQALKKSQIPRSNVFLTTKAYIQEMGYQPTLNAFDKSCRRLGTDYLDLYLIHMPLNDYFGSWRALEKLYKDGRVRAIGVCNFTSTELLDLIFNVQIPPMINQIENHPLYQRTQEIDFMRQQKVQPEAWAPFAEGRRGIFQNELLQKIAMHHGKTVAQVILRWNIQRGMIVIPKSTHQQRIQENLDIWDFSLSPAEMNSIGSLDENKPQMLDLNRLSEVRRVYDYLTNPVVTSL
ncbi:MAG: aldo/keto reductase [Lactobacillus sp.]|nr:aldo/keto reductase [Lactobacillus sp.]